MALCWPRPGGSTVEAAMSYIIEVLRLEHCNIEKLLRVLEQELSVFDRGVRREVANDRASLS